MGDKDKPEGPDLAAGVKATEIVEGRMLVGHVGDAPVLIARAGGMLRAIGALCTHYGAPLGEGLIVGDTVRCPWHHAHFCLRTGEALAAPAFDPVGAWTVEERDGMAYVRSADAPAAKPTPAGASPRVVIVGGGAAGFAAAEMLRRRSFAGSVTLLSADSEPPYDRPSCSKEYLEGKSPRDQTPLRPLEFYAENGIDLRLDTEVVSLDTTARTVSLKSGALLAYDTLILATGAEPQWPSGPGLDGANVCVLRTLADADRLIAASKTARRAAVIGSSFIGLEAAAALKERGLDVTVIAPEAVPLEKILGQEVGRWVQGVHEEQGVAFRLGTKVLGYADGKVSVDQGDPVTADLVVVGTGVKPRVHLAAAAGLTVDNGVVVDDHLKTSADGVYAAGDIARYPDPISGRLIRVEHWVHAELQGQYLARLITGDDRPFADPPFFWTKHYERSVSYSGHAEKFGPPEIEGRVADGDAVVRLREAGRLAAVATIDRNLESLRAAADFEAEAAR